MILNGNIEIIVGGKTAIVPASPWHELKNRSDKPSLMVNIHPIPKMITERA